MKLNQILGMLLMFKILKLLFCLQMDYSQFKYSLRIIKMIIKSMDQNEQKRRAKQALMSKLKTMKGQPNQYQPPPVQPQLQSQMPMRIDTEEDFRKMPYEGKAKYDNQLKALNALKNETEQRSQRPKKMFFEHYDTEEPYCPVIQNNTNPSGRPPNIPASMYQGITVKPKRPWVYLGTENLPPVEYQEINESSFKAIVKKNIESKQQPKNRRVNENQPVNYQGKMRKKPAQKKQPGQQSQFSEMDMSDEIVDEGESIFATETINKQSSVKKSKMSSMRSEHSVMSEDLSVSDGTETRNKHAEIFGSDEDDESEMFSRGTKGKMSSNIKNKKDVKKRPKDEDSDEDE